MKDHWLRFYRLPRQEKNLLFRAAGYLAGYVLALRLLGLKRTLALSEGARCRRPESGIEPAAAFPDRAQAALARARKLLGIGTCLSGSLALRHLLASAGLDAAVRIGTRRRGQGLEAHAWVEYADRRGGAEPFTGGYKRFPARF